MKITLNQQATDLQANATVADALAQMQAKPPFAVAVNTIFVPRTQYAAQTLNEGDKMEVISPVTGG
ncbi:sulfur carrier protein ThiS [Comamonas suwonensis]|uniref:Sulfur carrier protein ThiS n=1 Tax=Comamonas suwonensis TaxID=2606214 RepID=A0A843B553_9BURK|nr:sulfur carrier protein ThiS [Comamonas suwonensis]MBI1625793.1 sulfur carrier protein ThiS [Comamonas suwonensis]